VKFNQIVNFSYRQRNVKLCDIVSQYACATARHVITNNQLRLRFTLVLYSS